MKIVAPTKKPIKLDAIHANAGIEAKYRRELQELVAKMAHSFLYWTRATWKKNPPLSTVAQDKAPFVDLRKTMERLGRQWQRKFDEAADSMAKMFADGATRHVDDALMAALKKAGFTVKFTMSKEACEGYQAVLQENVSLIKSIGADYLKDVQGDVWRAVKSGYDLDTLSKTIKARYGTTAKRAGFIARDQSNKAKAVIENVRRKELGITEAIWQHSGAGKEPRPSHVAASGKKYDLSKGMYLDGKWVLPGEEINCRCTSRAIISGFED